MRAMRPAWMAGIVLLCACRPGLQGTYEDQMGLSRLEFEPGGEVRQSTTLGDVERRLRYELKGDQVRILQPGVDDAALLMTRVDEDTLAGPAGLRYSRVAP